MPPMRSLQPLLQISTPPWGSRPRPRHAFQIEPRLFHGRNSEEEGFPYAIGMSWQTFKREDVLRRLRFPREYTPTLSAIWWTAKHTPRLLVTLVYHGVRLSFWRMQIPQKEKVKSRAGRFFHDVVMQPDCYHQLAMTVKPWGYFGTSTGTSMEPTLSTKNMIFYASYSYVNSYDVSLGDVVIIVRPKCNDGRGTFGKRVAALEGSHIRVNAFRYKTQQKIIVERGHCFVLGDNTTRSEDSRHFGSIPIQAVWAKYQFQWGQNGFQWVYHDQRPWLDNKVIEHLAPDQNRPTHGGPLIKQPEKKPTVILRPKVNFPRQPRPAKKQRNDPRKKKP